MRKIALQYGRLSCRRISLLRPSNATMGRPAPRPVRRLRFRIRVSYSFLRRQPLEWLERLSPTFPLAGHIYRIAVAVAEWADALAVRLQPLSDSRRKFRGAIPFDAPLFPAFPSAAVHSMDRNLRHKEVCNLFNDSTSAGTRIFDASLRARSVGGETKSCCRERLPC